MRIKKCPGPLQSAQGHEPERDSRENVEYHITIRKGCQIIKGVRETWA